MKIDMAAADTSFQPLFVGDHPVLDFMNTVAIADGAPVDFLTANEDVLLWLEKAGLLDPSSAPKQPPASLLSSARALREQVRLLIEHRKARRWADVASLNSYLQEAASYSQLVWEPRKQPALKKVSERKTAKQLLAPLAESAADLLVHGDFDLIRKCEDPSCVLWFYDRTKSHRRRWCSMAVCGNRNKVKAFRERQQA